MTSSTVKTEEEVKDYSRSNKQDPNSGIKQKKKDNFIKRLFSMNKDGKDKEKLRKSSDKDKLSTKSLHASLKP